MTIYFAAGLISGEKPVKINVTIQHLFMWLVVIPALTGNSRVGVLVLCPRNRAPAVVTTG